MRPGEQVEGKTPTAPEAGAGSGAGLGVTPAHKEAKQSYKYEMPYRRCIKADGLTYPIAVCLKCCAVIEPTAKEYSKTGTHGTWYYTHKHPLSFVILKRSNSGKRSVDAVGNVPESLIGIVREAWIEFNTSTDFIEHVVREWAFLYKDGREEDLTLIPNPDGSVSVIVAGDW